MNCSIIPKIKLTPHLGNNHWAINWLCLFICLVSLKLSAIELTNGKYRIAVSDKANAVERFAAEEMQYHLEKITGKKFPIKKDSELENKENLIVIGNFKLNIFMLKEYGIEGFRIRSYKNNLYMAGHDEVRPWDFKDADVHLKFHYVYSAKGTLFAVYEFLEKYCDVRWLWPGKSGEYIPKKDNIFIKEFDIREKPDFILRHSWLFKDPSNNTPYPLWYCRARFGTGGLYGSTGHCWGNYIGTGYFKKHPEYYALIDGKRRQILTINGRPRLHANQVCTSNGDVVRIFVEKMRQNPKDKHILISLSPNDGCGFCECEKCRSQDAPYSYRPETIRVKTVNLSNRIFKYFVNPIAKELKKTHPKAMIAIYAYSYLSDPPDNIKKIEDNVMIIYTQNSSYFYNEKFKAEEREKIKRWGKVASNLMVYDYMGVGMWAQSPHLITNIIAEDIPFLHSLGYKGHINESSLDYAINGPNYYLLSKLLWNTKFNAEQVMNDYCNKAFGKAAKTMMAYLNYQERYYANLKNDQWEPGVLPQLYSDSFFKTSQRFLVKAKSEAVSDKQSLERVNFFALGLDFFKLYRDYFLCLQKLSDAGLNFQLERYVKKPYKADSKELVSLLKKAKDAETKLNCFVEKYKDTAIMYSEQVKFMDDRGRWSETLNDYYKAYCDKNVVMLPDKWRFKIDPDKIGVKEKWGAAKYDDSKWNTISTSQHWEPQGYGAAQGYKGWGGYNGIGWYRLNNIRIAKSNLHRKVLLSLGAVDESCTIYVNGMEAGGHIYDKDKDSEGWMKPREFDITKYVKSDNTFAIMVEDTGGGGGLWKKVYLKFR